MEEMMKEELWEALGTHLGISLTKVTSI